MSGAGILYYLQLFRQKLDKCKVGNANMQYSIVPLGLRLDRQVL